MIYLELLWVFIKIGTFTFGGGYAMLPLIQEEVIDKGWMTMEELVNFIAVSEGTPGSFAVNVATYIGTETAGILGAVCATIGVVLPSFLIKLVIAKFFISFKDSKALKGIMTGLKPAVVGLIAAAIVSVGSSVFFDGGFAWSTFGTYAFIASAIIFVAMLIVQIKKVHPIFIILISAALGIAAGYLQQIIIPA